MDTRKLLIADGSEEFRTALAELLQGTYSVRICGNGQEALSLLHSFHPDVLVLDLILPGLDGISLLHAAVEELVLPEVLVTSTFMTDYMTKSVDRLGISYVLIKPCDLRRTVDRINDLARRVHTPTVSLPDPRSQASGLLLSLGVPTNIQGYQYLREGILLKVKEPSMQITKALYPAVGRICDNGSKQVERCIRTAIEKAWLKRDDRIWQQYFPPGPDGTIRKPSNGAFISRLAETISLNQDIP